MRSKSSAMAWSIYAAVSAPSFNTSLYVLNILVVNIILSELTNHVWILLFLHQIISGMIIHSDESDFCKHNASIISHTQEPRNHRALLWKSHTRLSSNYVRICVCTIWKYPTIEQDSNWTRGYFEYFF